MIAVAGAGIIGLSCAWELARAGHRVAVFESGRAASEASWAGAGMLAPAGELTGAELAKGGELPALFQDSLRLYPVFVEELERETAVPIDYRRCGALEIAFSDAEMQQLRERSIAQRAAGILSEPATHLGNPALFYPDDSLVNPRHITHALLLACRRRGVEIREGEAVLGIEDNGRLLRTAAGRHTCDAVVIAAGAWSSGLFSGLPRSFPVKGHLIGWSGQCTPAGPILRNGHTYIVTRANGECVAGSSTEHAGFDRALVPAVVDEIRARVARLLPAAPLGRAHAWTGLRPAIESSGPLIAQLPGTRVFAAYGHYRNGILLAPETARRIARLIAAGLTESS